jgi:hypothetical protein
MEERKEREEAEGEIRKYRVSSSPIDNRARDIQFCSFQTKSLKPQTTSLKVTQTSNNITQSYSNL